MLTKQRAARQNLLGRVGLDDQEQAVTPQVSVLISIYEAVLPVTMFNKT